LFGEREGEMEEERRGGKKRGEKEKREEKERKCSLLGDKIKGGERTLPPPGGLVPLPFSDRHTVVARLACRRRRRIQQGARGREN